MNRDEALRIARGHTGNPDSLMPYPHAELESARYGRGYAFTDTCGPEELDGYVIVWDSGGASGLLSYQNRTMESVIADHLAAAARQHRHVPDDELGLPQRLAMAAFDAGADRVTGVEVDAVTLDYANHLLLNLLRISSRTGRENISARALFARDDSLLEPPMNDWQYTHPCPLCRRPAPHLDRYPRAVCDDCAGRTTDRTGRPIHGFNVSLSGGLIVYYADSGNGQTEECAETTRTGICFIDGIQVHMDEARFGGIVIQSLPNQPPHAT